MSRSNILLSGVSCETMGTYGLIQGNLLHKHQNERVHSGVHSFQCPNMSLFINALVHITVQLQYTKVAPEGDRGKEGTNAFSFSLRLVYSN